MEEKKNRKTAHHTCYGFLNLILFFVFFFEEVLKEEMVAKVLRVLIILETCSSCFNFV